MRPFQDLRSLHRKFAITASSASRCTITRAGNWIPVLPEHLRKPNLPLLSSVTRIPPWCGSQFIHLKSFGASMRLYFCAGLLASACCLCYSQSTGSIRGSVSFESGATSAHDATVHLEPLGTTARTGADGSFEFRNVPPGR